MNLNITNTHLGILRKFESLKGKVITVEYVKGNKERRLQPDEYVNEEYMLHDCIRGFYKPKGWECMLSYCATEKEENYGKQIVWSNYEKGKFAKIVMNPPTGQKDNRKISDINSAIYAMENEIPIGILFNYEKSKRKVLGLGMIKERDQDGNFIVYPTSINSTERKLMLRNNYYIFKTSDKDLVQNNILNEKVTEFEFTGLPNYHDEIKEGDIVFLVLGGDKPPWDIGLRGIAIVIKCPYDRGYSSKNQKYFKVLLKKSIIFKESITRKMFVPYGNTYDMSFIGPTTKGEPNQANVSTSEEQVVAALRGILDYKQCDINDIENIFGKDIKKLVLDYKEIYVIRDDKLKKESENIEIIDSENISQEAIEYISKFISSKGMFYDKDIINNIIVSLKTKPFVILSGISGTGKSKLVNLLAESLGSKTSNSRFTLIPVRPDWSDSSELIGYRDLNGRFHPGLLTSVIEKAISDKTHPYFICLDEMNLARVEYYLSDILSVIESRYVDQNGEIKTDKLIRKELLGKDEEAIEKYGNLHIPENLYIIGTVNMDETTFPFSKKVLDRANTIEFNEVNLGFDFDSFEKEILEKKEFTNNLLKAKYVKLIDCKNEKEQATEIINELIKINNILEKYNQHFAYRVRDEIVYYCLYALKEGLFTKEQALDYCIVQKILPKVCGSDEDAPELLKEIYNYLNNKNYTVSDFENNNFKTSEKYKLSNKKIVVMIRRFVRDGFTNFWQ